MIRECTLCMVLGDRLSALRDDSSKLRIPVLSVFGFRGLKCVLPRYLPSHPPIRLSKQRSKPRSEE